MQKQNIIKKNFEFQEIISSKVQVVSKNLILYYRPNTSCLRIGISISKKFGNAVVRNRQRRQVRAILDELNLFNMKFDIVLILRKSFLPIEFNEKTRQIKKQLIRIQNG